MDLFAFGENILSFLQKLCRHLALKNILKSLLKNV